MRKEELRKLRALNATKEMMEKAWPEKNKTVEIVKNSCGTYERIIRKYNLFLRCQNLGGYLKTALFFPTDMEKGISTPKYEVFLNVEGREYLTRELNEEGEEVRWLTAMALNLQGISWSMQKRSNDTKGIFLSRDADKSIQSLPINGERPGIKDSRALCRIDAWQQEVKDEQTREKEKKQLAPWDADMAIIPELPKGFEEWLKKEAPKKNYIFYDYQRGGARKGYCRHCGKEVQLVHRPYHRRKGKCPVCKRESEFICNTKVRKVNSEWGDRGQLIQRIKGGFVVRTFTIYYEVKTDRYWEPDYVVWEERRTLYRGGAVARYRYTMYKNKYECWCKVKEDSYWEEGGKLYRKNLGQLRRAMEGQTTVLDILQREKSLKVERYLDAEQRYPVIEKLTHAGLPGLAVEFADNYYRIKGMTDPGETGLAKELKLDKWRFQRLKAGIQSVNALLWLQYEKASNTQWPDDLIQYFAGEGIGPDGIAFVKKKLPMGKIYNYVVRQAQKSKEAPGQVLATWRDYLNMAEKLGMDTQKDLFLRPKDLREAHARAVELLERDGMEKIAEEARKKFPKADGVCQTLGKYEYQDKGYCIKAPGGIFDIVREGTLLHHCIHTCDYYFDRISRRESYLLFLRKEGHEDTPWYTLEVEPGGNIRQKRTTGDSQGDDLKAAMPFLKKWQKEVRKRMDEEERELAQESERMRREDHEKLRKDGNRIWRGRLAGMLLADVLEQDFMSAV